MNQRLSERRHAAMVAAMCSQHEESDAGRLELGPNIVLGDE